MFSSSDISRWLTISVDPITCEDWIANRETFGQLEKYSDSDKELEIAFQIESLRQGKSSGAKDLPLEISLNGLGLSGSQSVGNDWLLAPVGVADMSKKTVLEMELVSASGKEKKLFGPGQIAVVPLNSGEKYQVKIGLNGKLRIDNKDSLNLSVEGVKRLIIDTRGRPIVFFPETIQRIKNREWKEALNLS